MLRKTLGIVMLALLIFAGTATAQEEEGFSYSAYFLTYGTFDRSIVGEGLRFDGGDFLDPTNYTAVEDQTYQFFSQRIRPTFKYTEEFMEASVTFESDWVWGSGDAETALGFGTGKHPNVGIGTDQPNFLELKQAYVKIMMPTLPITLQGGLFGLFYGGWGAGYYSEETPQMRVSYEFGDAKILGTNNITAYYVPVATGSTYRYDKENGVDGAYEDDRAIFGVEGNIFYDTDSSFMRVTPTFWWITAGEDASGVYRDGNGFVPGLGFLGIFNQRITVLGSLAVPFGSGKDATDQDIDYRALYGTVDADYNWGLGKTGIHLMYQSGDDKADDEATALTAQQLSPVVPLGGKFWFFESGVFSPLAAGNNLIYSQADVTRAGAFSTNNAGAMVVGLYNEFGIGNLTPYLGVATAFATADAPGTPDDMFYGVEIDASVAYSFGNWRVFAEAAYLFAGDGYLNRGPGVADFGNVTALSDVQNASHFGIGLEASF